MNDHRKDAGFDAIADDYDRLWAQSLGQSGEGPQYFLEYKMRCLERLGLGPEAAVLDFGCGTGNLTALLSERHTRVAGYDPSHKSLEIARRHAPKAHFHADVSEIPDASFRVAVLSGVLHHVPAAEREPTLRSVHRALAPGGRIVVFEHNPLNPLTRRAVAMCPFDTDAELVWPWALRRIIAAAGFVDLRLDFIVFFPRALARLRWLEPHLRRLPIGAQTMLVARKPCVDDFSAAV